MRSPIQPVPMAVQKWVARARYLRWLDAATAWLGVVILLAAAFGEAVVVAEMLVAAVAVALAAAMTAVRVRWRPVSGVVGFLVSRALRPGDRAWYVRSARADLVIVTACRVLRVSIAAPELGAQETISVRRTRVLVVPATTAA
jgi:hypothetical protein